MKRAFEHYKPRSIEFQELVSMDGWNVKVYSITYKDRFKVSILENVKHELPNWITMAKKSNLPVHDAAFVIVHEAREGFLILFNWWTGGEMVETKVYFADFENEKEINIYPYHPKSLICIWELEVFAHERKAWIEHILMQADNPNFNEYVQDTLIS